VYVYMYTTMNVNRYMCIYIYHSFPRFWVNFIIIVCCLFHTYTFLHSYIRIIRMNVKRYMCMYNKEVYVYIYMYTTMNVNRYMWIYMYHSFPRFWVDFIIIVCCLFCTYAFLHSYIRIIRMNVKRYMCMYNKEVYVYVYTYTTMNVNRYMWIYIYHSFSRFWVNFIIFIWCLFFVSSNKCFHLSHLECHLMSISNLHLLGLFLPKRGKIDL